MPTKGARIIEPKKKISHISEYTAQLDVANGTGILTSTADRPKNRQSPNAYFELYPPMQLKRKMLRRTPRAGAERQVIMKYVKTSFCATPYTVVMYVVIQN